MSFEIWLQKFRNGEAANFPRQYVEEVFFPYLVRREGPYMGRCRQGSREVEFMSLDYPEGDGGEIFLETEEHIDGLTIHRPGTGRVFSDVLSLMKKAGLVLYWPGENSLAVHNLSLASHLPPDMLTAIGPANLVSSGDEILAAIRRS